jgi:hypothetical protein
MRNVRVFDEGNMKRSIPAGLIALCFWAVALSVVAMAWSVCSSCGSAGASARPAIKAAQKCTPAG